MRVWHGIHTRKPLGSRTCTTFAIAWKQHALLERRRDLALKGTQKDVGISRVSLEVNSRLPGVHLEEDILPFQGLNTLQIPANGLALTGDKGTCRGWITCSLLYIVTQLIFYVLCRLGTLLLGQRKLIRAQQASNLEEELNPSTTSSFKI